MAHLIITPGKWYFGIRCGKCSEPMLFAEDPSRGQVQMAGTDQSFISIVCGKCGHDAKYPVAQVEHFQAE